MATTKPRECLPFYCLNCGYMFDGTVAVRPCFKCKCDVLVPYISMLTWEATLQTHKNDRRFLQTIMRISPT